MPTDRIRVPAILDNPGGHARNDSIGRNVLRDHGASGYHGTAPNGDAVQDNGAGTDPDVVANDDISVILRTFFALSDGVHEAADQINAMIAAPNHDLRTEYYVVADDDLGTGCNEGGEFTQGDVIAAIDIFITICASRIEMKLDAAAAKAIAVEDHEQAVAGILGQRM
jgi:hypothetical protein